jgi:hypothetical protein
MIWCELDVKKCKSGKRTVATMIANATRNAEESTTTALFFVDDVYPITAKFHHVYDGCTANLAIGVLVSVVVLLGVCCCWGLISWR